MILDHDHYKSDLRSKITQRSQYHNFHIIRSYNILQKLLSTSANTRFD